MSRSLKKGPYVDPRVLEKVAKMKNSGKHDPIKTWSRACVIAPEMVGVTFGVHNGKDFVNVFVQEDMVGHRLGEFANTRNFRGHGSKAAAEAKAAAAAPATPPPAKAA